MVGQFDLKSGSMLELDSKSVVVFKLQSRCSRAAATRIQHSNFPVVALGVE